jgi:hypothetical protein
MRPGDDHPYQMAKLGREPNSKRRKIQPDCKEKLLLFFKYLVELRGFEPLTSAVRLQRSPI